MKKALYIVAIYLLVGSAWILFSSKLLYQIVDNNLDLIFQIEIYKGWFFVAVTALLLYILISKEFIKQKNIQQKLSQSNEQYKQLFQLHPTSLLLIDADTMQIVDCNEKVIRFTGFSKQDIIGCKANQLTKLNENELIKKLEAQSNRELYNFITSTHIANGELRFIEVFSNKQVIDNKNYYLAAVYDITDKLRSENMNNFVFDKSSVGIAVFDANGQIIRANKSFGVFFDQLSYILIGKNLNELYNSNDIDFSKLSEVELSYFRKNGKQKWGRLSLSEYVTDIDQNYRIGILEDITSHKEYESALKHYELVIEQSPSAIFVSTLEGIIEYINPKYTEITGYTQEEMVGSAVNFLGDYEKDSTQYLSLLKEIVAGKVWRGEYLNRNKEGSIYWEQSIIAPLTDKNGKVLKYIGIKENISPQKEVQLELILAKELAERASKAKSEFLANLSHELRTPMNAIMGFTELLSEKEQDKSKATMLGIMKQSEQDLMYLLNSLLQLSRIESGAVSLQEEHFTIEEILQRIETNFIVLATQKGLKIELSDKTGYIADFIGDKNKIEHVLNNLVDNALKFTLNGKIIVEIHLDYSTHNKVCLKLIVSDSGIGIPQELYGRIFEKFEQGEHYLKKKYNGAGLGLAIVKQLTEFMGGSIHLSSVVGIGSTFTVYIPIQSSINE